MTGNERPRLAVALWLLLLALAGWQLAHTRVVADLGAFLPPSATPAQQLLLDQMRSGVAAGSERFSAPALRAALEAALAELATQSAGALRAMLPRDPTGELRRIFERLPAASPAKRGGVWFTGDGRRALLVAETVAGGFDALAQEQAIGAVHQAVDPKLKVEVSGPGVFAAASRTQIERDAWLLSLASGALVLLLLLRIYRRPRIVALCFVPVVSGVLVGTAAV